MPELHPTPGRIALLREVYNRQVFRDRIGDSYISGGVKVTGRIAELETAQWVYVATTGGRWALAAPGRKALRGKR